MNPTDAPMTPAEAVAAHGRGELTEIGLVRALIAHPQWDVPVTEDAVGAMLAGEEARIQVNVNEKGETSLLLFSGGAAFQTFQQGLGVPPREQHFLTTTGTWMFNSIPADVTILFIDPFSPHGTTYSGTMIPVVRSVAAAVEVEEALLEIRTNPEAAPTLMQKVKAYENFRVFCYQNENGLQLCMAPDSKGRRLPAISTFSDAEDAYRAEATTLYPGVELRLLTLDGATIGRQLSQMTSLDGLVFNCSGPPRPVAFVMEFASMLAG